MQLIDLTLDHYYFYSPSTGGVILDGEICHDNEASLLGYWLDQFWQEPHINDSYLRNHWDEYLRSFNQSLEAHNSLNEFQEIELFFKQLEIQNAVVFKITDNLQHSPTAYFVIDFNVTN